MGRIAEHFEAEVAINTERWKTATVENEQGELLYVIHVTGWDADDDERERTVALVLEADEVETLMAYCSEMLSQPGLDFLASIAKQRPPSEETSGIDGD